MLSFATLLSLAPAVLGLATRSTLLLNKRDPAVVPSYKNWGAVTCWTDDVQNRSLEHFEALPDAEVNVENCLDRCEALSYKYAGLEFGRECFCGNTLGGQQATDGCTFACAGNPDQICGGQDRLTLYTYNPPPPPPVKLVGYLHLYRGDGSSLGYLDDHDVSDPTDFKHAGKFTFTYQVGDKTPFLVRPVDSHNDYVGGAEKGLLIILPPKDLGPKSDNTIELAKVPKTEPYSPPVPGLLGLSWYESAIWSYDPATKELSAQWINLKGGKPTTYIVYDHHLAFTGKKPSDKRRVIIRFEAA